MRTEPRCWNILGDEPEPGAPTWRPNRQLRELAAQRPEFIDWSGLQVMQFLYRCFDPRTHHRTIWKIAPGERGRLWDECRDSGEIRVGWDEVGDLGQYESDTDLKKALDRYWPDSSGHNLTNARHLLRFRDLEPGDTIVANRGLSEVLGVGKVSAGYRHEPNHAEYQHVVPVDWNVSVARTLDEPQRGWRSTFAKVSSSLLATITATGRSGPDGGDVPDDVQRMLDALDYKGQVILYGPPGTGKTRLAINVALAMAGRNSSRTQTFEATEEQTVAFRCTGKSSSSAGNTAIDRCEDSVGRLSPGSAASTRPAGQDRPRRRHRQPR